MPRFIRIKSLFLAGILALIAVVGLLTGLTLHGADLGGLPRVETERADTSPTQTSMRVDSGTRNRIGFPEFTGTAVVLDDVDSEPIARLAIEGRDGSGRSRSVRTDDRGVVVLPVGPWLLKTQTQRYRLHDGVCRVQEGDTCIIWATRVDVRKIRVLSVDRHPVSGALLTVHSALPSTLVTDEHGFAELQSVSTRLSIAHPDYAPKHIVVPRSLGSDVYEVFLELADGDPCVITCLDQRGVPMPAVRIHIKVDTTDLHDSYGALDMGLTDDRGQVRCGRWLGNARVIYFSGSACDGFARPSNQCTTFRLYRKCLLTFRLLGWTRDMDIRWRCKQAEPSSITATINSPVCQGEGVFNALFPLGLPIEVRCIADDYQEWRGIVVAKGLGEVVDVALAESRSVRRMTLIGGQGTITGVSVTDFGERGLVRKRMTVRSCERGVTFLVPTDECAVYTESNSGEVVILRGLSGENDIAIQVRFKGKRHIKFKVLDERGDPVSDVKLRVMQKDVLLAEEGGWTQ